MQNIIRYSQFSNKSSKETALSCLSQCKKYKVNFNPIKWVKDNMDADKDGLDDRLWDEINMAIKSHLVPTDFNRQVFSATLEYYTTTIRDKFLSFYIPDDVDFGTFVDSRVDPKVWRNLPKESVRIEFKSKNMDGRVEYCQICVENFFDKAPYGITIDTVYDANIDGEAKCKYYTFGNFTTFYIFPFDDCFKAFGVSPFDENNFEETIINGSPLKGQWLHTVHFELAKPDSDRRMNAGRGFFIAQTVLRKYMSVIDNVTTVKRESTAVKRAEKLDVSGVHIYSPASLGTSNVVFKPLADYGIHIVRERKEWQGGHHASPIPHTVREHKRYYKNGKVVTIKAYHKDCPNYAGNKSEQSTIIVVDK